MSQIRAVFILKGKDVDIKEVKRIERIFKEYGHEVAVIDVAGGDIAVLTPFGIFRNERLTALLKQLECALKVNKYGHSSLV